MNQIIEIAAAVGLTLFIIAVCVAIEHFATIERYPLRARLHGTMMNVVGVVGSLVLAWPISALWDYLGLARTFVVPLWRWLHPLGIAAYPLQWLALILVADFLAYWRHRAEHRWFWPIHVVHHAPRELHAANDIGHPVQVLFSIAFISIPMSLVQIDGPGAPFIVSFIVSLLSYYVHSPNDVHLGPLRMFIVDNRYHRIHHSIEPEHLEKNFGICFSLWDRMFGTAYDPRPDEWPGVGVASVAPPRTVAEYLMLPVQFLRRNASGADAPDHDSWAGNP